jgi:hypothetical protein
MLLSSLRTLVRVCRNMERRSGQQDGMGAGCNPGILARPATSRAGTAELILKSELKYA